MSTAPATADPAAALADTADQAGSVAAELTEQAKAQPPAKAPARKAPATKPAPAKTPAKVPARSPRLLRSLSWPPAADAPLTKEQKRVLATATVAAATKVLGTAAVKGLPADTARAQIAQWMAYLPHGGQWPAALPRPRHPQVARRERARPSPRGPGPFACPEPGRRAPRRTPGPCSPSPRHTERPARCVQVIGWPGARVGLRPHCPCPKRCLSPRP